MRLKYFAVLICLVLASMCVIDRSKVCSTKEDCVPAQCCDAVSCVNKANAPNCESGGCECDWLSTPGVMNCGQGYCDCIQGECKAVLVERSIPKTIIGIENVWVDKPASTKLNIALRNKGDTDFTIDELKGMNISINAGAPISLFEGSGPDKCSFEPPLLTAFKSRETVVVVCTIGPSKVPDVTKKDAAGKCPEIIVEVKPPIGTGDSVHWQYQGDCT